jgi:alanine racemase
MNRLGVKTQNELRTLVQLLETNSNIEIEGIYTHMATTGVYDPYYDKQIEKWNLLLDCIDLSRIKIVHLGRSLTLVNHAKLPFVNGIRLGIIMYGFNGSMKVQGGIVGFLKEKKRNHYLKKNHISESIRTNDLKLSTAFGLYTEVMAVKSVKKGEVIGYGAGYLALEDMKIAILPIGYADGMDKSFGFVMIGKNKCPIIGDICMDMTIVKVPSSVHLHDRVEIFGDTISVKAASSLRGVNAYHLFTSITSRVARVYNDLTEIEY